MNTLILAEHDGQRLMQSSLHVIGAAQKLDQPCDLLIAGAQVRAVAEQASRLSGIARVLLLESPVLQERLVEWLCAALLPIAGEYHYIVAPSTEFGRNLLPRLAAQLNVGQLSDIVAIHDPERFDRFIYAGSILATVKSHETIKVLSVRPSAFAPIGDRAMQAVPIEPFDVAQAQIHTRLLSRSAQTNLRPDLSTAKVVVAGGRGLGSRARYWDLLEPLAEILGAALGASRAAVDAGFAPNDYQIGQTGKTIAPHLYIAIGISGAVQHLCGIKEAKTIVAINQDPDAPIFNCADYAMVGDLFKMVPELTERLVKVKAVGFQSIETMTQKAILH